LIAPPFDAAGVLVAIALGLIFGSFANVCIHRIPLDRSIVSPGSACPGCGAAIRWFDNVPVLSWILLRGKCRSCGAAIHWRYPLVEALMGAGFAACWVRFEDGIDAAAAAWLFFSCVVLAFIDIDHFILPDAITLSGIAAGVLFAAARGAGAAWAPGGGGGAAFLGDAFGTPVLPLAAVTGAIVGGGVPLLARGGYMLVRGRREADGEDDGAARSGAAMVGGEEDPGEESLEEAVLAEGMGLGDVKMLAMVGAFLGSKLALVTILFGSISGTLLVLPYLAIARKGMKTPIPFGPFLALGAVAALFAGEEITRAYSSWIRHLLF